MKVTFVELVQYYHIATDDNTVYRRDVNSVKWEVFKSGQ